MDNNITFLKELVTPEKAEKWLLTNKNVRNISPRRVKVYAEDMKNGAWQLNGETIKFNTNDELIDGQHRLKAVILAGISVWMYIQRDTPEEISVFDNNRTRPMEVGFRQENMDTLLASKGNIAVVKMYLLLTTGQDLFSTYTIKEFLKSNADMIIASKRIVNVTKKYTLNVRTAVFQVAIFGALKAGEEEEKLARFCEIAATGEYNGNKEVAAIKIRNDILGNNIILFGGKSYRIDSERPIEKAIYDFCRGVPRVRSYKDYTEPTYIFPVTKIVNE